MTLELIEVGSNVLPHYLSVFRCRSSAGYICGDAGYSGAAGRIVFLDWQEACSVVLVVVSDSQAEVQAEEQIDP